MIEAPQRAQLGRSTTRCILRVWMNSEPVLKAAPQKKKIQATARSLTRVSRRSSFFWHPITTNSF